MKLEAKQRLLAEEGTPEGLPHLTKELLTHIVEQVGTEGARAIVKSLEWGDGASKELLNLIVDDLESKIESSYATGENSNTLKIVGYDASKTQKDTLDKQIDNKRNQIENLKKSLPSKRNKMKVSPEQQSQKRKQINDTKNQILDLEDRKRKI